MRNFIIILIISVFYTTCSFIKQNKLTLKLTVDEADMFYKVINNSAASHLEVMKCEQIMHDQLAPQMTDTTNKKP